MHARCAQMVCRMPRSCVLAKSGAHARQANGQPLPRRVPGWPPCSTGTPRSRRIFPSCALLIDPERQVLQLRHRLRARTRQVPRSACLGATPAAPRKPGARCACGAPPRTSCLAPTIASFQIGELDALGFEAYHARHRWQVAVSRRRLRELSPSRRSMALSGPRSTPETSRRKQSSKCSRSAVAPPGAM